MLGFGSHSHISVASERSIVQSWSFYTSHFVAMLTCQRQNHGAHCSCHCNLRSHANDHHDAHGLALECVQDNETKHLTLSEAPLLLMLNPVPRPNARELPVRIFEHHIEVVGSVQKTSFAAVGYSLASEEAERIGVDHIAKVCLCVPGVRGSRW